MGVHVMILAGGVGSRFWPVSRRAHPKQFLSISEEGESLIAMTARRAAPLCTDGKLWVITSSQQVGLVEKHVPESKIVAEPIARNTAASVGLAAIHLKALDPEGVMIVLPADHAVVNAEKLRAVLSRAVDVAMEHKTLVTIGIEPESPHTGYGYIQQGDYISERAYKVKAFHEKPDFERATSYLDSGGYHWNSGMFVWRVDTILEEIRTHMPGLFEGLQKIEQALGTEQEERVTAEVFDTLDGISIDFGIMEKTENCAVVIGDSFGWSDVGSWDAWSEHFPSDHDGNVQYGEVAMLDSRGCIVYSGGTYTAVLGCKDLVVINSGDVVMVCPKDRVQEVKRFVNYLEAQGKDELL